MKSKHPQAVQAVRKWISDRNLRPGASLPSAPVLAHEIGFSRLTTTLACNMLISGGLLKRNGYKLSVGGEIPVRAPISGEILVLSYLGGFSREIGRILTERGVRHRMVEISYMKHFNPVPVLRKFLAKKPAGVILWMAYWIEGLAPLLEKEKIPVVVCTDVAPPGLTFSTVGTDLSRGVEIALRHLFDLGHRHIAYLYRSDSTPLNREIEANFGKACQQLGISSSAIWRVGISHKEELREMLLERRKRHPEVTAFFTGGIIASLAATTFNVPRELSIVTLYELGGPLTSVSLRNGDSCIGLWACSELISRIQAVESGRPTPPPQHALFVPELVDLGSTASRAERRTSNFEQTMDADATGLELGVGSSKLDVRRSVLGVSPWESWSKRYAYLKKSRHHDWLQLDLSGFANHSMTREHGWLGSDPLLHFSPGLRTIHGVPFQVIEQNLNGGRAVVTFRSPQTHSTEEKELPVRMKLPVNGPVKVLYFLHGCGYARLTTFAEYIVHFTSRKGNAARIPLIPFGPAIQLARQRPCKLKPNLQDWWSGYKHRDFPHAKYVTIFNPADPQEYERYLYTLEWINPRPGDEVSHIEVRVDPAAGPTLALIAVTALV